MNSMKLMEPHVRPVDPPGFRSGRLAGRRILIIVSDWQGAMLWPGGIAEYIYSLTQSLTNRGDRVTMLAVVRSEEREEISLPQSCKAPVTPFPMRQDRKPASWLARKFFSTLEMVYCVSPVCRGFLQASPLLRSSCEAISNLSRVLSEEKPDAVILGHLDVRLYPLVLCLLDRSVPYGIIAHDAEMRQAAPRKRNDLVLRGTMLRGASWIAANSRHTRSLTESWGVAPERIRIIYPPISPEAFAQSAVLEPGSRDCNHFTLVSVCRLVRGKGIDLVLRALNALENRGIPYRYLIGGDGPEREPLQRLVDELGLQDRVQFRGSVAGQQKWNLLRRADVFVMPSRVDPIIPWQEGFGIALLEAAAFEVPAIASNSGGIPDAIVDGETGILVPEESPERIADALTLLYRNPDLRQKMGRVARERARTQFTPQAIAAQFQELTAAAART